MFVRFALVSVILFFNGGTTAHELDSSVDNGRKSVTKSYLKGHLRVDEGRHHKNGDAHHHVKHTKPVVALSPIHADAPKHNTHVEPVNLKGHLRVDEERHHKNGDAHHHVKHTEPGDEIPPHYHNLVPYVPNPPHVKPVKHNTPVKPMKHNTHMEPVKHNTPVKPMKHNKPVKHNTHAVISPVHADRAKHNTHVEPVKHHKRVHHHKII